MTWTLWRTWSSPVSTLPVRRSMPCGGHQSEVLRGLLSRLERASIFELHRRLADLDDQLGRCPRTWMPLPLVGDQVRHVLVAGLDLVLDRP